MDTQRQKKREIPPVIDRINIWVNPILTVLCIISAAFITYKIDESYITFHPIKSHIFNLILSKNIFLLPILCFLLIVSSIASNLSSRTRQKIENENSILKYDKENLNQSLYEIQSKNNQLHKELVETWLHTVFTQLCLCNSERVTIYFEYNDDFYLLGRYSIDPEYCKMHNRNKFPKDSGAIAKTWRNGQLVDVENCPSIEDDKEKYFEYQFDNYGYTQEKLNNISMRSCAFVGFSISDAGKYIGVILFESVNHCIVNKNKSDDIIDLCRNNQSLMSKFIRDAIEKDFYFKVKSSIESIEPEKEMLDIISSGD